MILAIARSLLSWVRYHANLRELSQLSERELADVGISRSDIMRVARQNAAP